MTTDGPQEGFFSPYTSIESTSDDMVGDTCAPLFLETLKDFLRRWVPSWPSAHALTLKTGLKKEKGERSLLFAVK